MKKHIHFIAFILAILPNVLLAQGFKNIAENYDLDFTYHTNEYGGGVSFVDFNQDGLDDLSFATEVGVPNRFFLNTGTGFEPLQDLINDTSGTKQLLWVDYNNDQLLDLYLAGQGKNKLFKNNGNLQMEDVTAEAGFDFPELISYCSTWFDYDRDGKLDLLVAHRTSDKNGSIDLYRNVDFISFEKMTIQAGLKSKGNSVLAMTTFDYNNDGWQDIFLGQDWEQGNQLFKNNGNGTFQDVSKISGIDYKMNSMTATVMDINEDGWQDLYVSNTTDGNILLVNDGQGKFEEKAEYYNLDLTNVTFGSVFFDAENDGDNDVHVGGMLINHTFENIDDEEAFKKRNLDWVLNSDKQFNNGVATGDFNNDGYIDIVKNSVSRGGVFNSKHSLWENQFSNHNFIKVQLEGTVTNRFAIGSKVIVYSEGKAQHKRVGCGESFSSQHSLIQHFGLRQTDMIDSIVVQWISGNVSVLTNVPTNQTVTIKEPKEGCTDLLACNYNAMAQTDNGSCRYAQDFYDCLSCISDVDEDGVCDELEIYGCNESEACNFSLNATENDGSCYYISTFEISGPEQQQALKEIQYNYPAQSGSRYQWSIENGSILAGNQSNEVTVIWYENEKGLLSVQEIDGADCSSESISKEVKITPAEDNTSSALRITPNPVSERLTVHNLKSKSYSFVIYNSVGQVAQTGILDEFQPQIEMNNLSSGIYILNINGVNYSFQEIIYVE